jgi:hypothetical protein
MNQKWIPGSRGSRLRRARKEENLETFDASGFSLLELMMVLGISSLSTLMILNQARTQTMLYSKSEFAESATETRQILMSLLSQPAACLRSFKGVVPGNAHVDFVYRAIPVAGKTNQWTYDPVFHAGTADGTGHETILESITLTGNIPSKNIGEMRAVFRLTKPSINGPLVTDASLPLEARTDDAGAVNFCQFYGADVDTEKALFCEDPSDCSQNADYCQGDLFFGTPGDCVCTGTRTTGLNIRGKSCTRSPFVPSPSPSPSPSSSASPSPSPSSSASPSPTPSSSASPTPMPVPVLASATLNNTRAGIQIHFTLSQPGTLRYAVYNVDPGPLTALQIQAASGTSPSGTLVASGSMAAAVGGTAYDAMINGLPDKSFYKVYFVAESGGVLDPDSAARSYDRVLPHRLTLMQIPTTIYAGPTIRYYVSYPTGYYDLPAATKVPVLLQIHGWGERSTSLLNLESEFLSGPHYMLKSPIPNLIDIGVNLPFITISPQCNATIFDCYKYLSAGFMNANFNLIKGGVHVRADVKRIYVIGISSGGFGAYQAAISHPADVAAIMPFMTISNGYAIPPNSSEVAKLCTIASAKIGVWAFHNSNDSLQPIVGEQGLINAINGCAGLTVPAYLTKYPGTVWPVSADAAHPSPAYAHEAGAHDAVTYTLGSYYYNYTVPIGYTFPTPIEPSFPTELAKMSAATGKPLSSIWDWFLIYSK